MHKIVSAHNKTFQIRGVPYLAAMLLLFATVVVFLVLMFTQHPILGILSLVSAVVLFFLIRLMYKVEPRPLRAFFSWYTYTRPHWDPGK
jgi:type IV secretory pathway VirB3-like protein